MLHCLWNAIAAGLAALCLEPGHQGRAEAIPVCVLAIAKKVAA